MSPHSATSRAEPAVSPVVTALSYLRDDLPALPERVNVAVDAAQILDLRALDAEQVKMDRQEIFADDVQAGTGQEMMDVGDPASQRILDRDHAKFRAALGDGGEGVLETGAGQGVPARIDVEQAIWELAPGSP